MIRLKWVSPAIKRAGLKRKNWKIVVVVVLWFAKAGKQYCNNINLQFFDSLTKCFVGIDQDWQLT